MSIIKICIFGINVSTGRGFNRGLFCQIHSPHKTLIGSEVDWSIDVYYRINMHHNYVPLHCIILHFTYDWRNIDTYR